MNSTKVLEEYYKFYGSIDFVEFHQNYENHAILGLKLCILREKVKLCIEKHFQSHKEKQRPTFNKVASSLTSLVDPQSPNAASIQKSIGSTNVRHWYADWWRYAKLFSKTEHNFVEDFIDHADLATFLRIITSCTLFPSSYATKAYAILRLRNEYSHAATYQTSSEHLNKLCLIIQDFEELLVQQWWKWLK